jgi:positive phototaxis protein PixI
MLTSSDLALTTTSLNPLLSEPLPADTRQKFLRFSLDQQDSALLPLEKITQLLRVNVTEILPIPETPGCVLGVCSWQGEMLWLVDLDGLISDRSVQPQTDLSLFVMVIQSHDSYLGLATQQIGDIELHDAEQIQPATLGLFPPSLQPFVLGVLPEHSSAVLNVTAILQCPLWQSHPKPHSQSSSA